MTTRNTVAHNVPACLNQVEADSASPFELALEELMRVDDDASLGRDAIASANLVAEGLAVITQMDEDELRQMHYFIVTRLKQLQGRSRM
jgi:hypothetical protein